MAKITLKLQIPSLPNFIAYGEPKVGRKEDGLQQRPMLDVAELDEDQLREIGDEWTSKLIEHAAIRRANKGNRY